MSFTKYIILKNHKRRIKCHVKQKNVLVAASGYRLIAKSATLAVMNFIHHAILPAGAARTTLLPI